MGVSGEEWRCCIAILLLTLRKPPAVHRPGTYRTIRDKGFQFGSHKPWLRNPPLCDMEVTAFAVFYIGGRQKGFGWLIG
jgi:hypothetical protein